MSRYTEREDIFYTAGLPLDRTTHLCIAAHQDDIEMMACAPILECYDNEDKWFTGVTVTDGAGSPRSGIYAACTNKEMRAIRKEEQQEAARIGKYLAEIQLGFTSAQVRYAAKSETVEALKRVLMDTKPEAVYIHNFADKHDTHVAVALRAMQALRELPPNIRPRKVVALEMWRGLDWVCDEDKLILPINEHESIAAALIGAHNSQIAGGKRYDLAIAGRRVANATFLASHAVDTASSVAFGIDVTPLIEGGDISAYIQGFIDRFTDDVQSRLQRLE